MPKKTKDNTKATGRDLFQTPAYATKLLLPHIPEYKLIWEPAAGRGNMVRVLSYTHPVWSSDIRRYKGLSERWDFINKKKDKEWMSQIELIVTNPPFGNKRLFYLQCLYYWKIYGIPFALLIPADYSAWVIRACGQHGCVKIIPTRRIDYITPTGKTGIKGHTSDFHSLWLTKGIIPAAPGVTEMYVNLSLEQKKDIWAT